MPKHILIADDEPSVLALLQLFFEQQSYQVTCACNGQEALDLAQREIPDLLLLDIQMPYKTGVEVVRELHTDPRFSAIPMIALTAHVRDFMPAMVFQAGFDHLMTKPFDFVDLRDLVERCLG
jgi:CheY-like chemotaxis protein